MNCASPVGPYYQQQNLIRLIGIFQDEDMENLDPTTVTLKIKLPDKTITTLVFGTDNIVKDSIGNYHFDFLIVEAGQYFYRWIGTGVCQAAAEVPFYVPASNIIPTTG